jgi:acetyl esterase/lipase
MEMEVANELSSKTKDGPVSDAGAARAKGKGRKVMKISRFMLLVPLAVGLLTSTIGDTTSSSNLGNTKSQHSRSILGFDRLSKDRKEILRRCAELGINPAISANPNESDVKGFFTCLYNSLPFKKVERIDFQHSNGQMLKARLYKPVGKGPWPLIVLDGGKDTGVIGKYELKFVAELLARTGYVVYGTTSKQEVAHTEVHDYYAGIDHIWKHFDFVKHETIIMGLSAGGALALEMAGDINASKYGVMKVIVMSTYPDLPQMYYFARDYIIDKDPSDHRVKVDADYIDYAEKLLKFPDTNPKEYAAASPKNYLRNIKVPILILHGVGDEVVPIDMGIELYNLAKEEGKDVKLIMLPGQTVHADTNEMLTNLPDGIGMIENILEIWKFLKS